MTKKMATIPSQKTEEDPSLGEKSKVDTLQISLNSIDMACPFEKRAVSIIFQASKILKEDLPAFNLSHTTANGVKTIALLCNKDALFVDKDGNLLPQVLISHKLFVNWQNSSVQTNFLGEIIHLIGHLKQYKNCLENNRLYIASRHNSDLIAWYKDNGLKTEKLAKEKVITTPDPSHDVFKAVLKTCQDALSILEPPFKTNATPPKNNKAVDPVITSSFICPSCKTKGKFTRAEKLVGNLKPVLCPFCGMLMTPVLPKKSSAYASLEKMLIALKQG
jgi:hypothetical protein